MTLWASLKRIQHFSPGSTKDLNYILLIKNRKKRVIKYMPDFLFVMQINGAVNEPKNNGCDSMEVRSVAANGEIFIFVFSKGCL